jgi:hypothetical protein
MIDNGLLMLSESAIGEKSIAESESNTTVHRAAFQQYCCPVSGDGDIRLILAAGDR